MNPVFLDTVGILALLERSDQWHEEGGGRGHPLSGTWET